MEYAKRAPEIKEKSFLNDVKDYGKTILKGSAEGITKLGRMFGPTLERPGFEERQTEALDVLLPTDEGFGQKALRRGLREVPSAIATGGGSAAIQGARALGAGLLGESAKSLGAPEWLQTAAEFTAFIGPDVTKKLLSSGKNKEIIDFGRKMGMTDEQLTPLLQSDRKQRWLAKLSPKRGKTEEALKSTKEGLGSTYSKIQESEQAAKSLSQTSTNKLMDDIASKLDDLPRELRNKVQPDLDDLLNNKVTGKSLMNFWSDLNSHFSGDKKRLSILKGPVKEAIGLVSPQLEKDFELANSLYSKFYPISKRLMPTITSDIVKAAETIGIGGSVIGAMFGHYSPILSLLGEKTGKQLAKNMLINPRFQQLSKKMVVAINQNKYPLAKKVLEQFKNEVSKIDKNASDKLESLTEEEFERLLNLK